MAAGTAKPASEPGWLARAVQWRWIKVVTAFVLAAIAGGIGWLLRPSAQEAAPVVGPAIGIVASHAKVQASVAMVLTVDKSTSTLQLMITPTPASRPVTFTVTLSNFPRRTTGTPLIPLSEPLATSTAIARFAPTSQVQPRAGRRYADYYVQQVFPAAGSPGPGPIVITSAAPLGEDEAGTQLRVAIPKLVGAAAGVRIPAEKTGQTLYAGSASAPGFPGAAFVPTLLPGLSTFTVRSPPAAPLADFQVLAGDPPTTLLGREWAWNGINGATVLAANVAAEDDAQVRLFWAGLALGLAAGAAVTGVIELQTAARGDDRDQQPASRSAR